MEITPSHPITSFCAWVIICPFLFKAEMQSSDKEHSFHENDEYKLTTCDNLQCVFGYIAVTTVSMCSAT